jgi:segregation and condensation protein B
VNESDAKDPPAGEEAEAKPGEPVEAAAEPPGFLEDEPTGFYRKEDEAHESQTFLDDEPTYARIVAGDEEAPPPLEAAPGQAPEAEGPLEDLVPEPGTGGENEAAAEDFARRHLELIVESLIFAADRPLSVKQLGELLGERDLVRVREAIDAIRERHEPTGIQLHGVAGGFQFRTHAAAAVWVQKLLAQKPVRLSRAQLETLSIVAYRQPITRPEIDEIRGVDSGGSLKTLLDRSLVRILGKKEEPGRPLLYGTTREFLEFFNLSDLKDLPTLREFHELSDEHRAQVEALEKAAPEGSVETVEEAAAAEAARRPLERVELTPFDDAAELEEIDRLITTAGGEKPPPGLPADDESPGDG